MRRSWRKFLIFALVLLAIATFFTGLNWGLPSLDADRFLFNGRVPWTGEEIMRLAGSWDNGGTRGADIAMHPLGHRDEPIILNDTDGQRAEIVRRFRLYSNQPDEMITFRSLARMKPGKLDLDPRLYQYGGLWIYPIGGLLKLASAARLVTVRTDLAFYINHPDAFGRFYLVARGYAALWGLLGVSVVYAVGREFTGKFSVGATAAALYATMPVVINAAHEAKPHLPGTVLTLITVWAGLRFARTGRPIWWWTTAVGAGAAMGMVLTGYAAFAVLPVMMMQRPIAWKRRAWLTACAGITAIAVFVTTNPYLPYDYLFNRAVLKSNIGNYGTFYQPGISLTALMATIRLLIEGMSPAPAIVGMIGVAVLFFHRALQWENLMPAFSGSTGMYKNLRPALTDRRAILRKISRVATWKGLIFSAPATVVLIQFVLLVGGKPAEYARFAITLDVILAITAAAAIEKLHLRSREKALLAILLVVATLFYGCRYDINYLLDTRADSSRRVTAAKLETLRAHADLLAVWAEPAPYCMPPVDLFSWRIVLLPAGTDASTLSSGNAVVTVRPVDSFGFKDETPRAASAISWANKPFEIRKFPGPGKSPVELPP